MKILFKPPQNHSGMQRSIHKHMFHVYWHQNEKIFKCVAVFYGLSHILTVLVLLDCLQIPLHSSKMKRLIFFFFLVAEEALVHKGKTLIEVKFKGFR